MRETTTRVAWLTDIHLEFCGPLVREQMLQDIIHEHVAGLCAESERLHWLPKSGIVELAPTTCLVGHGGWADGRSGDYADRLSPCVRKKFRELID